MYQFTLGLIVGVYIGTHYNCKPILDDVGNYIKNNLPKEKDKN